jgi:pyruvate/2-oxoglutarate dehydrogenase complex dihydrolipoamide dehydrogenase (E3) component/uncharacterized membrane protein YdjX (TVP38/TMEM64 family)
MGRLILLAVILAGIAAFILLGGPDQLTFETLTASRGEFEALYEERTATVLAAFFLLYIAVTALSLPGAAIMTLAAGYLFGLFTGTVLVSFASTIGATLAFLSSRYLLRDWVQRRFGHWIEPINEGVRRDGKLYLFSIRLVPAFPFFVVNLLMGLTPMRVWTFAWVSQLGMLIGTVVFVNAGTQLGEIEEMSEILSPALIGSFVLLALVPWIGKAIMALIRRRRVYAGFRKPRRFDRNLIVIGAGSAGLVSAYIAALVRAKVTLIEADRMGGDCLNTGCVPSKTLIKSAKAAATIRHADRFGLEAQEPRVPFAKVIARVRDAIRKIEPHDSVERFTALGVDVVQGYARLVDPWTVEVALTEGGTRTLTARSIVIATGAEPIVPPLPGIEASGYLTSETMWEAFAGLESAPRRLLVLGGGPIGCELAQAMARLGSAVTQVERGGRLLAREDVEVSALAHSSLEADGVNVLTDHEAVRFERQEQGRTLVVRSDGKEHALPYDAVLIAVGRRARLQGYGLEALGIEAGRTVLADQFLATKYPNILVAGDVAGPYQYTHVASHQAWYATVNALASPFRRFKADYRVIPHATFLDPEIARVGLNESEATERGIAYEVTRYQLDDLDRAIAEGETLGFVKVLTRPGSDAILGATIVGNHAGELITEFVLAMKHKLGLNKILQTIHIYPTMAEANKYVAGEWRQARKPERLLKIAERWFAWRRG